MDELAPVLTSWVEDGPGLHLVLNAAMVGGVVHLPLQTPPFEQATHVLEVNVPGAAQPFLLLADPVGFATNGTFPLQVRPLDDEQRARFEAFLAQELGLGSTLELTPEHLSTLPPPPSPERVSELMSRPPPDPLVGCAIGGGKFVVEQLLGSGAAGRVYKAMHRDLKKIVAVKVIHPFYQADPQYAMRFQGEALAASRIDHPNVLRILDFGQEPDGMLYIVMEFLEGRDLQSVIDHEGPLPLERIVHIGMQICAGLSVAHEAGIIHRDIKPENVVLVAGHDDEGRPIEVAKVCDFGIAQMRTEGTDAERVICGTPEYMSPEQWAAGALDARTDIYAVGITLYEMATQRVPFTATSPAELMTRVVRDPPPPPQTLRPDLDPKLADVIVKAIMKEPARRQASARDLRADLRALVAQDDHAARLARRREILDAAKLEPLDETASGFAEFFVALASAIMRTGYYERDHPEAATARARLAASVDTVLKNRGELSFARRDVGEQVVLSVVTGAGEVKDLKSLLLPSVYELYGEKFGEVFSRRGVVSLALRDGVDESELDGLVDLMSGPEISADELRGRFLKRGFSTVSILFAADLLGRKRKLPWQVDLCVSRLARDLKAIPLVHGMGTAERALLRTQIVGDVLRALGKPEQVRTLIDNADLIAAETEHLEEMAALNITSTIIDGLGARACTALARHLLEELDAATRPPVGGASLVPAKPRTDPRDTLKLLAVRFARDRSVDSDEVLRTLYDKSFLALPDLPRDLQTWIHAENYATELASGSGPLAALDLLTDPDAYAREVGVLAFAVRVLARRGEVRAISEVVNRLQRHGADASRHPRSRQSATSAAVTLEEPDVAICIAHTLLGGPMATRDCALALLARAGAKAAAPLCDARAQLTSADASLRARFVAAFRDIGAAGWPVLAARLGSLDMDADPAFIDDLLRATPAGIVDEETAKVVERFTTHAVPAVRRSAATALAGLAGPSARAALVALYMGKDDGVRLGALAGLRRIGAIDHEVVQAIDKVLGLPGAGEELRAASAAALVDALPQARAAALSALTRTVKPPRKSFVGRLSEALGNQESTMVIVASARALLTLGGPAGRDVVRERVVASSGGLRQALELLLGQS